MLPCSSAPLVPDGPYQAPEHKHGQVVNVGRTLPDGNRRLAREVPYGTPRRKKRYSRRNLSESRNGSLEHTGLKRMPNFGRSCNGKEIACADFLVGQVDHAGIFAYNLRRRDRRPWLMDAILP